MKTYKKGDDFQEKDVTFKTFGITEIDPDSINYRKEHSQKIEVYDDEELRDKIIELLNRYEREKHIAYKNT